MAKKDQISIFIIDDDKLLVKALEHEIEKTFSTVDLKISVFETGEQAALSLGQKPDIAIIDYHLDSKFKDAMNGVQLIDLIKKNNPATEVIMFTGEENAHIAVKAIQHGAHDYIVKNDHLFRKLNMSLLQCIKLKRVHRRLRSQSMISALAMASIAVMFAIVVLMKIFAPGII